MNKDTAFFIDTESCPPEVQELLRLMDQHVKTGGDLKELFVYNRSKRTWKLRTKYQLSDAALQQRRMAARRPRKKIPDDSVCGELLNMAFEMKKGINHLIEKVRHLQKKGNGASGL